MSDQNSGGHPKMPFGFGVVAAVSLILGIGIANTQERLNDGEPLLTLAYILVVIGVLATAAGALSAISNALGKVKSSDVATATVERAKRLVGDVGRPKITLTSGMSTADELEKWVRLRDTGVISPQEFDAARAELLKGSNR